MLDGDIKYGKALQIYLEDAPYLVIGSDSNKHHEMLKIFLLDNKITFKEEMLHGPNFGPSAIGENYRLIGAGRAFIHYGGKVELSGQSDSYRISPNKKHVTHTIFPLLHDYIP